MHTRGVMSPTSESDVRDRYADLGLAAQVVVKESARAMDFDSTEYRSRVTSDVVETGRDALFASLLAVHVGTREEYEAWLDEHDPGEAIEEGSDQVDRVAWHDAPAADAVVAATFQDEEDAAVATLQRIAFGRIYRELL